jgi:cytoskeletal protein RodZ
MREAHKIELKQMAKSIRLNEEILCAIEENRWSYFRIDAYLRSYMVAICEKMSLDKSEVLRRLAFEKNSLSSMVATPDKPPEQGSSSSEGGGGSGPQVKIAIALIIVAALFFVARVLNNESNSAHSAKANSKSSEELDVFAEDAASNAEQDSLAVADPTAVAKNEEIKMDSSAIDTLRFECTPVETDSTCGISLKGLDVKVRYFKKMERRYITRVDTSQITITVPMRTKLFFNNERLDYEKLNTILFYNGGIVNKYNRELK